MQIEELGLEIHDVVNGNSDHLEELINLYLELFPEYARYVPVMRHRAEQPVDSDKSMVVHQWLATINNEAAGMVVFKYNINRNCGIGLDLAVAEKFKPIKYKAYGRLAHLLIDLRQEQVNQDAFMYGKQMASGVLVEVESRKVLETFKGYGMVELDINYNEPPSPESVKSLIDPYALKEITYKPMYLGVYPAQGAGSFDLRNVELLKVFIYALLVDHYGLQEDHWVVVDALKSISKDV